MDREPLLYNEPEEPQPVRLINGLLPGLKSNWLGIFHSLIFLKKPKLRQVIINDPTIIPDLLCPIFTYQQYLQTLYPTDPKQVNNIIRQSDPEMVAKHDDLVMRFNELVNKGVPTIEQLEKFRDEINPLFEIKEDEKKQPSDSH